MSGDIVRDYLLMVKGEKRRLFMGTLLWRPSLLGGISVSNIDTEIYRQIDNSFV